MAGWLTNVPFMNPLAAEAVDSACTRIPGPLRIMGRGPGDAGSIG